MDDTLATIVASAAALLFATMGETITEKSGVVNLSLEGSFMLSALAGFAIAFETSEVLPVALATLVGFGAAAAVGALFAFIVAFGSVTLRLNQVAVGFVLALLGIALASFLGSSYTGKPGLQVAVGAWAIPGLKDIPFLGEVFFNHNLAIYASLVTVVIVWWYMYQTRRGLKLQGIGERPDGAYARGVPVNRGRYWYTMLGGALVGIGGATFTLSFKLGWSFMATRNFGWIALAIVIFGGWHPFRVAFGVLLFGFLQWLALDLQDNLPDLTQILPILPFALMIFALVLINSDWLRRWADRHPRWGSIVRGDAPSALGTHFSPE